MKLVGKKKREIAESVNILLKELDKGIDSMENGKTVLHNKAMQMIRKKLKDHAEQHIAINTAILYNINVTRSTKAGTEYRNWYLDGMEKGKYQTNFSQISD